jgi:hypothetical protein
MCFSRFYIHNIEREAGKRRAVSRQKKKEEEIESRRVVKTGDEMHSQHIALPVID